jgi:hypothetical protein
VLQVDRCAVGNHTPKRRQAGWDRPRDGALRRALDVHGRAHSILRPLQLPLRAS